MIISNKFIFVRVPRTASSSMEKSLEKYHVKKYDKLCNIPGSLKLSHIDIKALKNRNYDILNGKFKFAFVRNPFDRLVSYYHYYSKRIKNFRIFIMKYLLNGDKLSSRNFWYDQSYWLTNESGKIDVDFIGRFENLEDDFKKICEMIEIPYTPLPWLKKSKGRSHYTKYYDSKLIKIVKDKCRKDLELFNYRYNKK